MSTGILHKPGNKGNANIFGPKHAPCIYLGKFRRFMPYFACFNELLTENEHLHQFPADLKAFNLVKDAVEEDLKEIMEDLENCALFESY